MDTLTRRPILSRVAPIACACACAAGTYHVTVDVLRWRQTPTALARRVLVQPGPSDRQRVDAAVIAYNDAVATIEALRAAAERQDAVGVEARNLLAKLAEKAR